MSEADDNYEIYGTLLEPYDEDNVPRKKAFTIEDQIATDAQGRRRFHGAFTGGFSAGFFNTVGSLEGWKPSEFKSSRSDKAEKKKQKPEDFMDDEDVGEFGIAPQVVRATSDYDNTVPRKRHVETNNVIPGVPALELLQPARDTIGMKLLKQMGWKPGQGIGPRITKAEKIKANREHQKKLGKIYGCEIPEEFRKQIEDDEESEEEDPEITFAPDDFDPYIYKPKDNTFGMGYSGLDKKPILSSHVSLFPCPQFKMQDGDSKKISIAGQAFGVGAFEDEDEDIYSREDMTKYDFELEGTSRKKIVPKKEPKSHEIIVEGFVPAKNPIVVIKTYPPPVLPKNFIPKHGVRISRFEPLPETHPMFNKEPAKPKGKHHLTAEDRSKILNSENIVITKTTTSTTTTISGEDKDLKTKVEKLTSSLPSISSNNTFKPFIACPDKQKRYEDYLDLLKKGERDKLNELQPVSMSEWEKEREKTEFEQAARLFKPVQGLIFDRFVQSSTVEDFSNPMEGVTKSIFTHGDAEMREAAKNKKFGHLTRRIEIWKPKKLLCKRFNVPEPEESLNDAPTTMSSKRKPKFSVFDYYEAYQKNNAGKQGPEPLKQKSEESKSESDSPVNLNNDNISNKSSILNTEKESTPGQDTEENPAMAPATTISVSNEVEPTKLDVTKVQEIQSDQITSLSSIPYKETSPKPSTSQNDEPKPVFTKTSKIDLPEPKTVAVPTDPVEKIDLFKSIFLSSSESESEPEEIVPAPDKMAEMKKLIMEEQSKPTISVPEKTDKFPDKTDKFPDKEDKKLNSNTSTTTSSNSSKGIFAGLDWDLINRRKPENTQTSELKEQEKKEDTNEDVYGPKLPNSISKPDSPWKPTFNKVAKPPVNEDSSDEDEWLEMDISRRSSSKKHKKHKSKKNHDRSHKKHKDKHKKKKHSSKYK